MTSTTTKLTTRARTRRHSLMALFMGSVLELGAGDPPVRADDSDEPQRSSVEAARRGS